MPTVLYRAPSQPSAGHGTPAARPLRTASLSLAEAAEALNLSASDLLQWLVAARWIRRDRRGNVVASAAQLTCGHLNQPVLPQEVGERGCVLYYGAVRFTPRGMANLRTEFAASRNAVQ